MAENATHLDAIVFDVGGVIVTVDETSLHARLASRCRPGVQPGDVARSIRESRWDEGAPIADLHARLRAKLGYAAEWPVFRGDWCHHLAFDDDMLAFVETLSRRHRVILFSNTNQEHWDHLLAAPAGHRLMRFEQVLSHRIGLAKPSVAAFLRMAELTGIAPERSLFFDDRPENIGGARDAGFRAELFVDGARLRRFLADVGIVESAVPDV